MSYMIQNDEDVWCVYEDLDQCPIHEGNSLRELKLWTERLIAKYGEDAYFEGSEIGRTATPEEIEANLQRQKNEAELRRKSHEEQERATYAALHAKFGPKPNT